MSFDTMKVSELKDIAESFAVDLEDAKNKSEILAILAEEGITFEMYNEFINAEKEEIEDDFEEEEVVEVKTTQKKQKASSGTVLVKMDRQNFSYETYGYKFTATHPYVAMPEKDAQLIFDNEEGFRMATPREVQEFYS